MFARSIFVRAIVPLSIGCSLSSGSSLCDVPTTPSPTSSSPNYGPKSLAGTSIMIFGGSAGIGLATAKEGAKQGAANIWIIGRSEEKLAKAKAEIEAVTREASFGKVAVTTASCDLTDEGKIQEFMSTIPDNSIDHLVTTPGGSARLGNLVANKRNCNDVRRQFDLKYFAQLGPVLAATDKMRANGSITMCSGILSRRTGRGNDALAVSNAAIETTVRCLANDYGFDGKHVRVNCLSPGMTLTGVYGTSDWAIEYQKRAAASVPLQRNGLPEEMAHAIVFLQTNTFMTGVTIDVDGGNIIKP